jgi:hypothetical protein
VFHLAVDVVQDVRRGRRLEVADAEHDCLPPDGLLELGLFRLHWNSTLDLV